MQRSVELIQLEIQQQQITIDSAWKQYLQDKQHIPEYIAKRTFDAVTKFARPRLEELKKELETAERLAPKSSSSPTAPSAQPAQTVVTAKYSDGFERQVVEFLKNTELHMAKLFDEVKAKRSIPAGATAESLMKRGFLFLEVSDWEKAITYFDNALDIDPECAQAYIGMLCAELGITSEAELEKQAELFDERPNYKMAIRFADEEYRIKLETYIGSVKNTIESRIEEKNRVAAEEKRIAEEKVRIAAEEKRNQFLATVQIHGIIEFGKYRWRVLDIQENAALIMMEGVLEIRSYHKVRANITWSDCDLRNYLNGEFYNSFELVEKEWIINKTNKNANNPLFNTAGGLDTDDYVFLLSLDEVLQSTFFGESSDADQDGKLHERVFSSQHDNKRKARLKGSPLARIHDWWLRTPGEGSSNSMFVSQVGSIYVHGRSVELTSGVRPALWLKLD